MQIRSAFARNRWPLPIFGLALLLLSGLSILRILPAAATAPCVPHANTAEELDWLQEHLAWRNQYIPGSDPSNPLQVSSTLNAAAAGYANYMADHPGAVGHSADGAEYPPWSARAKLCGYPPAVAIGAEAMSLVMSTVGPVGPVDATAALNNMTTEVYGGGIRIPANVDGFPMRCIGVAHARSLDGMRDVWIALIMSADGPSCPQTVLVPPATPTGPSGFPTRTATPTRTPTAVPTSTPKATPTKQPAIPVFKLRMAAIASDGGGE
ncbi:MAG: hypothetical protein ABIP13_07950 [Tepidiformaceae bacterium]